MFQAAMLAVEEFHNTMGIAPKAQWMVAQPMIDENGNIAELALKARVCADELEDLLDAMDPIRAAKQLRAHLIIEEFVEFLEAMIDDDELAALDALTDMMYVVVGTGVQLRLPLDEAFREVHRSNMTKSPTGPRCRDKGPNYQPPNLRKVLDAARQSKL